MCAAFCLRQLYAEKSLLFKVCLHAPHGWRGVGVRHSGRLTEAKSNNSHVRRARGAVANYSQYP